MNQNTFLLAVNRSTWSKTELHLTNLKTCTVSVGFKTESISNCYLSFGQGIFSILFKTLWVHLRCIFIYIIPQVPASVHSPVSLIVVTPPGQFEQLLPVLVLLPVPHWLSQADHADQVWQKHTEILTNPSSLKHHI